MRTYGKSNPRLPVNGRLQCRVCHIHRPLTEFYKNRANASGHEAVCKPCARIKSAEWRATKKQRRTWDAAATEKAHERRLRRMGLEQTTSLTPGWRLRLFKFYRYRC